MKHESDYTVLKLFNTNPKKGIEKIKSLYEASNKSSAQAVGEFFYKYKDSKNLDLQAVGDYLGTDNKENAEALNAFVTLINFKGQNFLPSLTNFLHTIKLPGEAQKIDKLVEAFSQAYHTQNKQSTIIAHPNAAYILAFQIIMLNTDLHNPNVKKKMTMNEFKKNLLGCNKQASSQDKDFEPEFLEQLYNEIKAHPFALNFVTTNPGYEIKSRSLNKDFIFNKMNSLVQLSERVVQNIFKEFGQNISAHIDKPTSWLHIFTGYEATIKLKDSITNGQATVQIYKPSFFSRWFLGELPKVIIQPVYIKDANDQEHEESIQLAAKIAARFTSHISSIKATYDYESNDLKTAYDSHVLLRQSGFKTNRSDDTDEQSLLKFYKH